MLAFYAWAELIGQPAPVCEAWRAGPSSLPRSWAASHVGLQCLHSAGVLTSSAGLLTEPARGWAGSSGLRSLQGRVAAGRAWAAAAQLRERPDAAGPIAGMDTCVYVFRALLYFFFPENTLESYLSFH